MPHEIRSHRRPRMRRWGPAEAAFVAGVVLFALSVLAVVLDYYCDWRPGIGAAAVLYLLALISMTWALGYWRGRDRID